MVAPIDVTGARFGRAVAVECVGSNGHGRVWRLDCDCGNSFEARLGDLRSGATTSCGCAQREATGNAARTHGMAWANGKRHPLYHAWLSMRQRCNNPRHKRYADYGGRGIGICKEWDSFPQFLLDVGEKPGPGYSIDRIDNDGNYEPGNIRWATYSQQSLNRRKRKS